MSEAANDDNRDRVRAQFGASVADYVTSDVHAKGESLGVLIEIVQPRPEWRALDIATGAGHAAFAFAPRVASVTALDLTPGMVDRVNEDAARQGFANVVAQLGDAEALPFPDESFDLVTCRLAHHHFPDPDRAVAEMARVLRPGGTLGFTDNFTVEDRRAAAFYNEYETLRDPSHHRVQALSELRAMFARAGFGLSACRELTKEFEFHAWADRQRVSPADKERLLELMRRAPDAILPLFRPRWADGTMYFSLWEAAIAAKRVR